MSGVYLTCVKCGYETMTGGAQACPNGCIYGKKHKPVMLRTSYALRNFKKGVTDPEKWLLESDQDWADTVAAAEGDTEGDV